jgi:hypothetical protein
VITRGLGRLRPALPVVIIGALLALVPFPTCILRAVIGIPCPACGLTRATLALAHLDLAEAQRFHPLALALLGLAAVTSALAFVASEQAWRRILKWTLGAAGVSLILVWLLRFAGLFGGPVP